MVAGVLAQNLGYSKMFLCFTVPALAAIAIALADDMILRKTGTADAPQE
jgi:NADH:ubiquinone oxidoreductase subunit 6 (subunit J)